MNTRIKDIIVAVVFSWISLFVSSDVSCQETDSQSPSLDLEQSTFPARGRNETLLHIKTSGRYSIQVKSQQGTRIEVVDRMAGPFVTDGQAGISDGRIDLILDTGTYKIRLESHEQGTGDASLAVFPFHEAMYVQNICDLPYLENLKTYLSTLNDLEQRSWWIEWKKRDVLRLEIQGRNVKDCRLWKDGAMLEDITPTVSEYEPVPGQPMTYIEFHHDLNPGLYLITCYGGKALLWADGTEINPLYVKMGSEYLGENGQYRFTISPFGREAFRVAGNTNFIQLIHRDKKQTELSLCKGDKTSSRFEAVKNSAYITKESRDPWCTLYDSPGNARKWVVVTGQPGDQVELNYFIQKDRYTFDDDTGTYWISTLYCAESRDAIDPTAILSGYDEKEPVEKDVIRIGTNEPLRRKVNLLGETTVHLFIADEGTYCIAEIAQTGATAQYRFDPFIVGFKLNYNLQPFKPAGSEHELVSGYYVLTMQPQSKGILTFAVYKKGEDVLTQMEFQEKATVTGTGVDMDTGTTLSQQGLSGLTEASYGIKGIVWPEVRLTRKTGHYTLWLNRRAEVSSGFIVRQLPLDLFEPLPVTLNSNQDVPIKFTLKERSRLIVDGGACGLNLDGRKTIENGSELDPGTYTLYMKNYTPQSNLYRVRTVPYETFSPPKPEHLDINKILPLLSEERPHFIEFDRNEKKHFLLKVAEPGLYRLETTGRLSTRINVRTLVNTSLFSAENNGIGRNALVQQYLRPGDYLVAVQALGTSKGRSGIHLFRTEIDNSEGPSLNRADRRSVSANAAIKYRIQISKKDDYCIDTLGLGKRFANRIEDSDGWPLVAPGSSSPISLTFMPGVYYYYSLPEPLESRRITFFRKIQSQRTLTGKGPHTLTVNEALTHIWMETPERSPDLYTVDISAPIEARLDITEGMEASIYNQSGELAGKTRKGSWTDEIPEGIYNIRAVSVDENNRFPYSVCLNTKNLIPGTEQTISSLPATLKVRLKGKALVDIFSFGSTDVKATLIESTTGEIITINDDMDNDWNFRISRMLDKPEYRLELEPEGSVVETFDVIMAERRERVVEHAMLPFNSKVTLSGEVLTIPFSSPQKESLYRISAKNPNPVNIALVKDERVLAEARDTLFIPLPGGSQYSLLVWCADSPAGDVQISIETMETQDIALGTSDMIVDAFLAARINNPSNISHYFSSNTGKLYYSPETGRPCMPVSSMPEDTTASRAWLVADNQTKLSIKPFTLKTCQASNVLMGDVPLCFSINHKDDDPMLVRIDAAGSPAGVMIYPGTGMDQQGFGWVGMVTGPHFTLASIPGRGEYIGKLWLTHRIPVVNDVDRKESVMEPVSLKLQTYPIEIKTSIQNGRDIEHTITPGKSYQIAIDKDDCDSLDLIMSQGIVACSWEGGLPLDTTSALSVNTQARLAVGKGKVILFNTESSPALFRFRESSQNTDMDLAIDKGIEAIYRNPGILKFPVDSYEEGKHIFIAGSGIKTVFKRDNGIIEQQTGRPDEFSIISYEGSKGVLEVEYLPGLFKIWNDLPGNESMAFMGNPSQAQECALTEASAALDSGAQLWPFTLDKPCYIIAGYTSVGAIALLSGDKVLDLKVTSSPGLQKIEHYLNPGTYMLFTRPIADMPQQGSIYLKKILPIDIDPEKTHAITLIGRDETHVYRFKVNKGGNIGIGFASKTDLIDARLYDTSYNLIRQGPYIFTRLEQGEYIITVETKGVPSEYRPIILGAGGSRKGVPDEIIQQYLKEVSR